MSSGGVEFSQKVANKSNGITQQRYEPGKGFQNIAIALSGKPVPLVTGTGAIVSMNSQRFSLAAVSPSASRSWLSSRLIPSAVIISVWIGRVTPSTFDGVTSWAASPPRNATPRALIHGATDACSPAAL